MCEDTLSRGIKIFIDGASLGNPGPAGIGAILYRGNRSVVKISKYIGNFTNNVAEYTALIYALQEALILGERSVLINTDSELLYKQINRQYKVKDSKLKPLYGQIIHLRRGFKKFKLKYIAREKNKFADRLASRAAKRAG